MKARKGKLPQTLHLIFTLFLCTCEKEKTTVNEVAAKYTLALFTTHMTLSNIFINLTELSEDDPVNKSNHLECLQRARLGGKPLTCTKPFKPHNNSGKKILEFNKAQRI